MSLRWTSFLLWLLSSAEPLPIGRSWESIIFCSISIKTKQKKVSKVITSRCQMLWNRQAFAVLLNLWYYYLNAVKTPKKDCRGIKQIIIIYCLVFRTDFKQLNQGNKWKKCNKSLNFVVLVLKNVVNLQLNNNYCMSVQKWAKYITK